MAAVGQRTSAVRTAPIPERPAHAGARLLVSAISLPGLICIFVAPILGAQPAESSSSGTPNTGSELGSAQELPSRLQELVEEEKPSGAALLQDLLSLSSEALGDASLPPSGGSPERRADVAAAVATVLDARAELTAAARWYLSAFNAHPVPSRVALLLRAGELEFSVGELDAATLTVRLVRSLADGADLQQRALILEGRIAAARGNPDSALARLEEAATLGGTYGGLAEAEASRIRDGRPLADGSLPSPASLFGEVGGWPQRGPELSAESLLTSPGPTGPATAPASSEPPPNLPAPASGSSAESSPDVPTPGIRATAIQTGSFRVEENAGYMARDLEDLGFSAMIRRTGSGDSAVYQVLVPIPPDADPDRLRLELREFGLEGFFVRD